MLRAIELDQSLDREAYKKELLEHQVRIRDLAMDLYRQQRSLVMVFEGWDAAGKGGAIRRLTERVDPRGYQVYSIGPPEGEDKRHHYLWRFWRRLEAPRNKQLVLFDRSWYGRVLVERVEGFASEAEWRRAYREINDFERQMTDHGILLVKLWFHISPEEQLRRFEAREQTPHKRWKLTDEDWRNREKWDLYHDAVDDMLQKTSTLVAPWTVIEANDKPWARVKTLATAIDAIESGLDSGRGDDDTNNQAKGSTSRSKSNQTQEDQPKKRRKKNKKGKKEKKRKNKNG